MASALTRGGRGDDWIDVAFGGSATSEIFGGPGDDAISTYFGSANDVVNCGPGYDRALAAADDTVGLGCEDVDYYDEWW